MNQRLSNHRELLSKVDNLNGIPNSDNPARKILTNVDPERGILPQVNPTSDDPTKGILYAIQNLGILPNTNPFLNRKSVDPEPRKILSSNDPIKALAHLINKKRLPNVVKNPLYVGSNKKREQFPKNSGVFEFPKRHFEKEELILPKNYELSSPPFSGDFPGVTITLSLNDQLLEPMNIILDRAAFPIGVENFYLIAQGTTVRQKEITLPTRSYIKNRVRSYDRTLFFDKKRDNYIIGGDIYRNDGTSAGSIYYDQPFEYENPGFYYSHNKKGLLSLVPYLDPDTNKLMYDSTFAFTLAGPGPTNDILSLDQTQIVIGKVQSGIETIDIINSALEPNLCRRSPIIRIDSMRPFRFFRRESRTPFGTANFC